MKIRSRPSLQRGVTLVELMITLVITLVLVTAAAYVYLGTRETQRAIERNSANRETGTYALELLGRDIMNAGFYPTIEAATQTPGSAYRTYSSAAYPPNNWTPTSAAYSTGVFGCEKATFNPTTGACNAAEDGAPDSIVINYFSSDLEAMGSQVGTRFNCTGADAANDLGNNGTRSANPNTPPDEYLPPGLPLFVSNRYTLTQTDAVTVVDQQNITTQNLACSGNGGPNGYQPLLQGFEDLQFSYAVYNTDASRVPDRFYTAAEIENDLTSIAVNGNPVAPWARVVAIRVCIMTRSLGAGSKISDKAGSPQSYVDCNDETIEQPASDTSLHKRFVQVFGVRNNLNLTY